MIVLRRERNAFPAVDRHTSQITETVGFGKALPVMKTSYDQMKNVTITVVLVSRLRVLQLFSFNR